jgi:hypothetical protein
MKELILAPLVLLAAWAGIWLLSFATEPVPANWDNDSAEMSF